MPSRNGIFYNLIESPWKLSRHGMIFYFSSETHYNRFLREVDKRERQMTETMTHRIGCFVNMEIPACVQLYRQVEQRGFLVRIELDNKSTEEVIEHVIYGKGVYATCLEHLELDGLTPKLSD